MAEVINSSAKKAKVHTMYYVSKNGKKIRVPGTTTITDVMNKPALVKWANDIGLMGINVKYYVDDLAGAGKCCHRMCELDCKGIADPTRHPDMREYTGYQIELAMTGYIKFLNWKEKTGFIATHNELELVHSNLMYGGTVDIVGYNTIKYQLNNGTTLHANTKMLIDIKTSKGVFPEHKTQVGGGYSLLLDHNNIDYSGNVIILRLGRNEDEGFEEIPLTKTEIVIHQKRFKICRELYEINKLCNKR